MNFMVLKGGNEDAEVKITERAYEGHAGVTLADVEIRFPNKRVPEPLTVQWELPLVDMYSTINLTDRSRNLTPAWHKGINYSSLQTGAPIHQVLSADGKNRLTIALSDAKTPTEFATGVHEKHTALECEVRLFARPIDEIDFYRATIYLDVSDRRYELSRRDVDAFWRDVCGYSVAEIPETARRPLYSCWYSFHQSIDMDEIVHQCELAKAMGMESVIVDDGWQCDDTNGGYEYCGDWEPVPSKVPDMKAFADRIHATGMKLILWFSVPFVGRYSKAYGRFSDMLLNPNAPHGHYALDPRYPEVRRYLTGVYRRAVREWGLDGFKLDFIDSFRRAPETKTFDERWDIRSLEDAVDVLLSEIVSDLRALKPDILIEFRQRYFGPVIRKYGNMIRVGDCPNDSIRNRTEIMELRYVLGGTAVHSDMLMWNPNDTPEAVATQLINVLYGVPQISVLLDRISAEQRDVLTFYLHFWNEHRETLLDGELEGDNPEASYSQIRAARAGEEIAVAYTNPVVTLDARTERLYAFNATAGGELILRTEESGARSYRVTDCRGREVAAGVMQPDRGVQIVPVPRCGMLEIGKN